MFCLNLDLAFSYLSFNFDIMLITTRQSFSSLFSRKFCVAAMSLADVPDVDLDPSGVFKYILIKCTEKSSKNDKMIVRGYGRCPYHADILDETRKAVGSNFKMKCVGGGRIRHEPEKKDIFVYGYSQGYGLADHSITVDLIKKSYEGYTSSFSNDGY